MPYFRFSDMKSVFSFGLLFIVGTVQIAQRFFFYLARDNRVSTDAHTSRQ